MARTYRRQNASWLEYNCVGSMIEEERRDPGSLDFIFNRSYHGCTIDQIEAKKKAQFHSDSLQYWNASANFRRCLNSTYRAKEKQALRVTVISGNLEGHMSNPHKHNANWLWF